jgi:hypothetical protein
MAAKTRDWDRPKKSVRKQSGQAKATINSITRHALRRPKDSRVLPGLAKPKNTTQSTQEYCENDTQTASQEQPRHGRDM